MTENPLADETITDIVQHIEPTWELRGATPATEGAHIVSHLDVETPKGPRDCVLKATPPDRDPTCGEEARLLAVLDAHTSLTIPEVLGAVDEHEQWPTPLFLATTLPGANHARTAIADFATDAIERLGRSTGRQLAALHDLEAVDSYGFVEVDRTDPLDGGRPSDDLATISVDDPIRSWPDYIESEVDRVMANLEGSRFEDVLPVVRPFLEDGIDDLTGPFEPVLARIDQSLDNCIVDPETTAVTGWLDWEFCVAATPASDLAFVEHSLAGGHWTFLPDVPNYRETIREALFEGYAETGRDSVVQQARDNHPYYTVLAETHAMANFEHWFTDLEIVDTSDADIERAAETLREWTLAVVADY